MKNYTAVTQVSATKFEVEKVSALNERLVKTEGILVALWQTTEMNDKYCEHLAKQLSSGVL